MTTVPTVSESKVSEPMTVTRLGGEETMKLIQEQAAAREKLIKERPRDKLRYLKNGVLLAGGFLGAGMKGYNFALDVTEARRKRNEEAWLAKNRLAEDTEDDEDSNDLITIFEATSEDGEVKTTEDGEEKTSSLAKPIYWVFNTVCKLGAMVSGGSEKC